VAVRDIAADTREGTIRIAGLDPRRYVEAHGISYLSELVSIQPAWRTVETLKRYALLAGVPARIRDARVEHVIEWMGLGEHRTKRVKQLSKGNLQRLGLAQALLTEERVVVLDEPTHGLDPVWTQRFRDVVASLRREDRIILIASHNLDELARLADRVAIIDHGRLQRVVEVRGTAEPAAGERAPYRVVMARGAERLPAVFPAAVCAALGVAMAGTATDMLPLTLPPTSSNSGGGGSCASAVLAKVAMAAASNERIGQSTL
jgi:ABC-type multidrug transport system ATPase subunit